jgi:hypothetical protein
MTPETGDLPEESIVVDGIEVSFDASSGDGFVAVAEGRVIGRLELVRDSTELVAFRPSGEPLRTRSRWGGEITARFGSRELAVRSLLRD